MSGGALNSTQTKPNQNKHGMNDVVPQGGIITATDRMLKIFYFFPAFANEMSVCVCVRVCVPSGGTVRLACRQFLVWLSQGSVVACLRCGEQFQKTPDLPDFFRTENSVYG